MDPDVLNNVNSPISFCIATFGIFLRKETSEFQSWIKSAFFSLFSLAAPHDQFSSVQYFEAIYSHFLWMQKGFGTSNSGGGWTGRTFPFCINVLWFSDQGVTATFVSLFGSALTHICLLSGSDGNGYIFYFLNFL